MQNHPDLLMKGKLGRINLIAGNEVVVRFKDRKIQRTKRQVLSTFIHEKLIVDSFHLFSYPKKFSLYYCSQILAV